MVGYSRGKLLLHDGQTLHGIGRHFDAAPRGVRMTFQGHGFKSYEQVVYLLVTASSMRASGCHRGGGAGHVATSRAGPRRPFLGADRPSTSTTATRISPPPLTPTTTLNAITNRVATGSFTCPARPLGLRPAALRTAIGEGCPAPNVERRPSHVASQGRELADTYCRVVKPAVWFAVAASGMLGVRSHAP